MNLSKRSAVRALAWGLFISLSSIICSCSKEQMVSNVQNELLFNLSYGNFEDELNVFDIAEIGTINTRIAMKEGFFYILNGEARKIMEMNSYGALLNILYNDETNPRPSVSLDSAAVNSTRKSVAYPFNRISSLAVDSNKHLYVVDTLAVSRKEVDAKTGQALSQIVLRFDESGNYIDYIGQQGPGGTPFPYIDSIYATDSGELVVVSTTGKGKSVWWFSRDGFPVHSIVLSKDNIPNPFADGKTDSFLSIQNIVPDYRARILYMSIDYFTSFVDEASRVQSGINFAGTYLYPIYLEKEMLGSPMEIPSYTEEVTEEFSKQSYDIPYDFLGVTANGWLFFVVSVDGALSIQMVQLDGQRILKRNLPLDRENCLYYSLDLSSRGIISALIIRQDKAEVSWWRTDSLIQAVIQN